MAIQSAVGIVVLVSGALVLAPVEGVIAALLRPTSGGRLLRRMVPAAVLVPAAFVIPIGRGANEGYYGFDVGMLLFLIATVSVSLPVLFWTARSLDASEAHAKAESERFSSVLRAATEHSIVGTDVDGLITVFNEGAERLLGYSAKEVVGREMTVLHDPAEVAARAAELGVRAGLPRPRRRGEAKPGGDARVDLRPAGRRPRARRTDGDGDTPRGRDAVGLHGHGLRPQRAQGARAGGPAPGGVHRDTRRAAPPSASTRPTRTAGASSSTTSGRS